MEDTRVILLNYKRPHNTRIIVGALSQWLPVTVINNGKALNPSSFGKNVEIINNSKNLGLFERWRFILRQKESYAVVIDDDILPSYSIMRKIMATGINEQLAGIYGKRISKNMSSYDDLEEIWCEDIKADLLVSACSFVRKTDMKKIWKRYIDNCDFYHGRGDDLLVSMAMTREFKIKPQIVSGKVICLPEGEVGLNQHPTHKERRWSIIQDFIQNNGWT